MAEKLVFLTAAVIIAAILSAAAFAQYETLAGITAESPEYNEYKMCVDSCKQCETNCKANTYRRASEMQGNEGMCSQLPEGERQMCLNRAYTTKAISSKNSADCEKISETMEKNSCILNVQSEKAIANENEAECNSVPEGMAEMCRQSFYQRMAMLKSDETYCTKITDENSKNICSSTVTMQKGALAPPTPATTGTPPSSTPSKSKSLIIYGIIGICIIIAGAAAVLLVKKAGKGGRKEAPLTMQAQYPQGPPLVLQKPQMPVQQFPKEGVLK